MRKRNEQDGQQLVIYLRGRQYYHEHPLVTDLSNQYKCVISVTSIGCSDDMKAC